VTDQKVIFNNHFGAILTPVILMSWWLFVLLDSSRNKKSRWYQNMWKRLQNNYFSINYDSS